MVLKKFKKYLFDVHSFELLLLIFSISLPPLFLGGEFNTAKVIFIQLPLFYLLILFLRRRTFATSAKSVFWIWIAFLSMVLLSTFLSISYTLSIPKFFELLGIFLYFLLFQLVVDRKSDIKLLSYSIVVVGLILSIAAIFFIIRPPINIPTMNLVYAKMGHNHLADYLIFTLPIVMALFLREKEKIRSIILTLLVIFFFISFYLTFARAAFLIMPLLTILLIKHFRPSLSRIFFLSILGVFPVVMVIGIFLFSQLNIAKDFTLLKNTQNIWLSRQITKPIISEGRLIYWKQAFEGFKLRPVLGNGPGTFRLTSTRFKQINITSWFAHNIFFNFASEIGLVGLFLFITLLGVSLKKIKISKKYSLWAFPLFLGAMGSLLQAILNWNFQFIAIFVLFWVILSTLLKLSRESTAVTFPKALYVYIVGALLCFMFASSSILSGYHLKRANEYKDLSSEKAYNSYRVSMMLPSFDIYRFNRFLDFVKSTPEKPLPDAFPIDYILSWNKEDPFVFLKLSDYYDNNPNKTVEYLEKAVEFDPMEFAAYRILTQRALDINDYKSAINYLFSYPSLCQLLVSSSCSKVQNVIDQDASQMKIIEKELANPDPIVPYFYAKLFNKIGKSYLETGRNADVLILWTASTELVPDMSHYRLELSSLNYYVLNDPETAKAQIEKCLEYDASKPHCLSFPELDNLGKPGFLSEDVDKI